MHEKWIMGQIFIHESNNKNKTAYTHLVIRATPSENVILSYFTILKNYFIIYTIPFYNIPKVSTLFSHLIYLNNISTNKIIYPKSISILSHLSSLATATTYSHQPYHEQTKKSYPIETNHHYIIA